MTLTTLSDLSFAARRRIIRVRSRRWLLVGTLVTCCASVVLVARAYNGSSPEAANSKTLALPKPKGLASASSSQALTVTRELVGSLKFSLFDVGIYPREVHVDKGLIAITIEDYSGGSAGVIVDRETGAAPERAGRVDRAGSHWRSRGEIRLGPGRYRVYMADRPANQALLVVEP